ncbi:MAG: hypothetical protein JSR73_10080 [Proteobacteria bacterium]|nr:hypothetical protein [Pseudomonadota bacterium]
MNFDSERRFIVMAGALTDEQQKNYILGLQALGAAWFHHTRDSFLVATKDGQTTATSLRAMLVGVAPGVDSVVIEVGEVRDWALLLKKERLQAATDWMMNAFAAASPRS